jgi:hypothetical protein
MGAALFGPAPAPPAGPVLANFTAGWPGAPFTVARASKGWHFNNAGVLTEAVNDTPRLDHNPSGLAARGLLREGTSTNFLRNPRAEGASAPSTLPTHWACHANLTDLPMTGNGLTFEVVGSGTEDGIPYADIRLHGTTTDWTYPRIAMEVPGGIPGDGGGLGSLYTHTGSVYLRRVAGNWQGAWGCELSVQEMTGSTRPWNQSGRTGLADVPTGALRGQRYVTPPWTSSWTGRTIVLDIVWHCAPGIVFNHTLRIGAPQIERQAFATSPIFPPVGTLAASTRAGELVSVALPPRFAAASGVTIAAEYALATRNTAAMGELFAIGAAGTGHSVGLRDDGTNARGAAQTGSLAQTGTATGVAAGTVVKAAVRATASQVRAAYNGTLLSAGTPDVAVQPDTAVLLLPFAQRAAPASVVANGHIRKVEIHPTALPDGQLEVAPT